MSPSKPRVLLIGWDAADWKVIRPLLEARELPHLARLIETGTHGNIATLYPPMSPMLWTSIATGKRAVKHGIFGFTEPTPDGARLRAVTNLARRTKALWNILHQSGKRSVVAGWWPSFPVEPIDGIMISNAFHSHSGESPFPLPRMAPRVVHPPAWEERLAELRVHPLELQGEILRMFVPELERVDQETDKGLHALANIVAQTMSIHAAATDVLSEEPWDFAAVYYDAIDHFCHRFMMYHPPRLGWVDGEKFEIYKDVVANAYRYHDAMLGELLKFTDDQTYVVLLSDHGFHPDEHRRRDVPAEMGGPATEHRHFGVLCVKGPGIRGGESVFGATLLDIAPTILQIFGLPVGDDMDGKVLVSLFRDSPSIQRIPSWDSEPGESGSHPADTQLDPVAAAAAFDQLVNLGYVKPRGQDADGDVADHVYELCYNRARSYWDAGDVTTAREQFNELLRERPHEVRVAERLAECLLTEGDVRRCERVIDEIDAVCDERMGPAIEELRHREGERPLRDLRPQQEPRDNLELFERNQLIEQASGYRMRRYLLRMRWALAAGRGDEAWKLVSRLEEAAERAPGFGGLALTLAQSHRQLGHDAAALQWAGRALGCDSEDWQARGLMARLYFDADEHAAAFENAVESLALVPFQPGLQCLIGACLEHQREWPEAERAFQMAVRQMPGYIPAHEGLERLYRGPLERVAEADASRRRIEELTAAGNSSTEIEIRSAQTDVPAFAPQWTRPNPARDIVIVSGLPRSGTSMMMQMLAAGGMSPLTDGERAPDAFNPRGYFELTRSTALAEDASWLEQARGRAVKIVASLLPQLPQGESYRVIMMQRDLRAVLASQTAMLHNRLADGTAPRDDLRTTYRRWMREVGEWIRSRPDVALLPVLYDDAVLNPGATARRIAEFLGRPFDEAAASAVVALELRHFRPGDKGHVV